MRFTKLKAAGVAAGVAAFAFISVPASAGSTSIPDGDGVDYDAACLIANPAAPTPPPPPPEDIKSPGNPGGSLGFPVGGDGCEGISTYDGSTELTDISSAGLSSAAVTHGDSTTQLTASWDVAGAIPAAGSTCNPQVGGPGCPDLPDNSFVGGGLKVMFQVPARQNNTPTNSVGGGCPRLPTGQVFDQHEHWLDGHHHFIGFDVVWNGAKWIHSAQIGTYDSSPDGAFFFNELGVNDGVDDDGLAPLSTWDSSDPNALFGTHWNVTHTLATGTVSVSVDGVVSSADATNCATGVFDTVYAKAGDAIINVKGLSTADKTVTLPITVPLSLVPGFADITSVGGFIFFSDVTAGNSANEGLVGTTLETLGHGIREELSYTNGILSLGLPDTLGDSLACPTPTFGGLLPTNPFLNPAVGCYYDDDNIPIPNPINPAGPWIATDIPTGQERGTFLSEFWDTNFGFTA